MHVYYLYASIPGVTQVLPLLESTYPSTQAHVAVLFALSRHSCSQLPLFVSQGVETTKKAFI